MSEQPELENPSDNTPHEAHFYDSVSGPVHTGTGDIYYATSPQPPPATRKELLAAIREANAELRDIPDEIAGVHIDRAEVEQIVEWIKQADSQERLGMVLDQPGSGKTVVMHDVLVRLENENVPVLAIKADFLSGIKTRRDLAERLRLPDTVEACARHLAAEGRFIVLLDQLDALSLSLSRNQTMLDMMMSTLVRLRNMDNVRIVASCRTFDLNIDPKLSQVKIDRKFSLRPLADEEINKVLQVIGVDPVHLLPAHRALLATPLHLEIYARVISSDTSGQPPESFHTLQELYEALWQKRIRIVPPDVPDPKERRDAIYQLVEVMQNGRQIAAPIAVLDDYAEAATYLERVSFIRREGNNWLFFHQTLFDYCYARRFVAQGNSISQEILNGQQGLFERSQMVQVLAYLRGANETAYRRELTALLFSNELHPHLNLLLIGWFGSLPNPTAVELQVARRFIQDEENRARFFRAASGNVGWFAQLREAIVPAMLRSRDEQEVNLVTGFLTTLVEQRTEEALAYMKPYLGESEAWDERIANCLINVKSWRSDQAVEIICDLFLRRRTFHRPGLFLYNLRANPVAGCRVLRIYLDGQLDDIIKQTQGIKPDSRRVYTYNDINDRFTFEGYLLGELGIDEFLKQAKEMCPDEFVEQLLPWFIKAAVFLSEPDRPNNQKNYPFDPLFSAYWFGEHLSAGATFAVHMAEALQRIAQTDTIHLRTIAAKLIDVESLAIHRVLAQAYLANPKEYADDIFEYLLADSRRLNLGEHLESPRYDSRRLFVAALQHLDDERRLVLERMIMDLRPHWELRGRGQYGKMQLCFLKNIPFDLLSESARHWRQELEHKFPDFKLQPPQGITGGGVGPPIEQEAQAKMSDEAWLGAMRKYNDDTEWDGPKEHFLKGGVIELSRSFTEQVKQYPERFYHLVRRFDETISLHYVAAAITGLAESTAPVEWTFDLVRRFADQLEGEFRRYVCWALSKRAKEEVPDDLLELMAEWALRDPDPEQELWRVLASSGQPYYGGDPHGHGINTNRGAALRSTCHCAFKRAPPQFERVFTLLERISENDPSTAVRSCVVDVLGPLLNQDANCTLEIFEHTIKDHLVLLQSPLAHRFLSWVYNEHFDRVRPFIVTLLAHSDDSTRQAGARLACLAAFFHPEADELAKQALNGDEIMRRGSAQVYAHSLENDDFSETCRERLLKLMHDPDEEVRKHVGECFVNLRDEQLDGLRQFIEAFLNSPALLPGAEHLIEYLNPLAIEEHELALDVTERILDIGGGEIVDMRRPLAIIERDLVKLPLTVYTHTLDTKQQEHAMMLFEQLLVKGSRSAVKALSDWDRR